jgi:hypothetical protein
MKEVIIRLGEGQLETGFNTVNIELKHDRKTQWEDRASLDPAPELRDLLNQWQLLYPAVLNLSPNDLNRSVVFDDLTVTNISSQDLKELNHNFRKLINNWLDRGSFARIGNLLRTELNVQDRITIAIITDRKKIWQLPWHFWDLFNSYPHAVEVFSQPKFTNVIEIQPQQTGKVRILGLFGQDPALELNPQFLATLPQTNTQILTTTSVYQIADLLTKSHPWNIFIFNGHGETIEHDALYLNDGIVYLDNQTPLEISRLKIEVERAVKRGLKIAIFNCCRGLGLAAQLSDVNLPYTIVMREKIPNRVAQQFLVDLLAQYSQGDSFPAAFRYARQRLVLAEGGFAQFADWLPVLFHNPLSQNVTWQDLARSRFSLPISPYVANICRYLSQPKTQIWTSVGMSLLATILALSLMSTPQLINLENAIIDRTQAVQVAGIQPNTSQVTILNYADPAIIGMGGGRIINNGELLASKIKTLSQTVKPSIWIVDLDFAVGKEQLNRSNLLIGCTDRDLNSLTIDYDRSELTCNRSAEALQILLDRPYFQQISQPNFRLNPHLLSKINSIDLDKIQYLPVEKVKQLFDDKIVLVGILPAKKLSSSTIDSLVERDALALDRMIRAADPQQQLSLFTSWTTGLKLMWILLWSVVTAIATWQLRWQLLVPISIVIQIAISGALLVSSQGVPIVISLISTIAVTSIILSIQQIADRQHR